MTPIIIYTLFMASLVLAFFSVAALADWVKKVFRKGEQDERKKL